MDANNPFTNMLLTSEFSLIEKPFSYSTENEKKKSNQRPNEWADSLERLDFIRISIKLFSHNNFAWLKTNENRQRLYQLQ